MKIQNPYGSGGTWLRGNLHAHTTESDGRREPQVVIDDYAERGYDFLMISDHDMVTEPDRFDAAGMVLIPGNEVTAAGPHLLHVNASRRVDPLADRQGVLDAIAEDPGAFAVLAHPNWRRDFNHYPQPLLHELRGHIGIEIYNGVIERLPGSPYATDRWDMLLGGGQQVWGFAHDDSHRHDDVELGWNVVLADARHPASILDAFRRGAFYASTGVALTEVTVTGTAVSATASQPVRWDVITDYGVRVAVSHGQHVTYEPPADARSTYVRLEAHGASGARAWTQPFFITR